MQKRNKNVVLAPPYIVYLNALAFYLSLLSRYYAAGALLQTIFVNDK